jgi:hypothetical protein
MRAGKAGVRDRLFVRAGQTVCAEEAGELKAAGVQGRLPST